MPRRRESLKYALNKRAFQNTKNSKNNNTETTYKRSINQFVEWAKKRGYKTADEVTKETIQEYEEFLEGHPKSYQPSTTVDNPHISDTNLRCYWSVDGRDQKTEKDGGQDCPQPE